MSRIRMGKLAYLPVGGVGECFNLKGVRLEQYEVEVEGDDFYRILV
jgi:hypothetical protein